MNSREQLDFLDTEEIHHAVPLDSTAILDQIAPIDFLMSDGKPEQF